MSVAGSGCGKIALVWWVLDRTGSPKHMAAIMGPALFARYVLGVLLGPLGDKVERRKLILAADVFRGCLSLLLATMFFSGHYSTGAVLAVNLGFALGAALFETSSKSIVPHLVPLEELRDAVRQGQALMSLGEIAGGLIGGMVVSVLGAGAAFVLDALSYFAAAATAGAIRTRTGTAKEWDARGQFLGTWVRDIRAGFSVVLGLPPLVGLICVSVLSNLLLAPISMEWAVLIKETKNLPPWFLGALTSSFSLGAIGGSMALQRISRGNRLDRSILAGVVVTGMGIFLLPHVPNIPWAWLMAFLVGVGSMWTEIPMHTQLTLAMPDEFRARVDSIIVFCCGIAAPLGMTLAAILIGRIGAVFTISLSGILLICLAPCFARIPNFFEFFRQSPLDVPGFLPTLYPGAFQNAQSNQSVGNVEGFVAE